MVRVLEPFFTVIVMTFTAVALLVSVVVIVSTTVCGKVCWAISNLAWPTTLVSQVNPAGMVPVITEVLFPVPLVNA